MQTLTPSLKKQILVIKTIAEAIEEAGQIPSGHLYALLMPYGCTLEKFNFVIDILVDSGKVKKQYDLLIWIG